MTLEEERQLGKEFMRNVHFQLELLNEPVINDYVQSLGENLASQLEHSDHKFNFFVVNDKSINAFAGPGGHIGIYSGLILAARNEDELASVISHEIAHVTQRHLVRSFEKQSKMGLTTLAAILAAVILGNGNGEVTEAVIAGSVANSTQSQLNFSRDHEREADYVGIELLSKAHYDPENMATFFETLLAQNRYGQGNIPEFILTHPLTTSRIADARNRAQLSKTQAPHHTNTEFGLIKTRIAAHIAEKSHIRLSFESTPDDPEPVVLFQKVLVSINNNQFAQANKQLKLLIATDRQRTIYVITQTEIDRANNKLPKALKTLSQALLDFPNDRPLTELYAQLLLETNQPEKAYPILRKYINHNTTEPEIYKLLADSAKRTNKLSEAYEAIAEFHFNRGEIYTALEHLKRALKIDANNTHRKLRLTARQKTMRSELIKIQPILNDTENKYRE